MNKGEGFTTIEMMVVVAVIVIAAAIAFPSISGWASKQRLKGAARDLVTHFQLARMEAIKRNTPIELKFYLNSEPQKDRYILSKNGVTLKEVSIPDGVNLKDTTFVDNKVGYKASGFPDATSFLPGEPDGRVQIENDQRIYKVIVLKTSGGLKLDGPVPK